MVDTAMFPLPVTVPSAPDDSTIVRATNTTPTDQQRVRFKELYKKNDKAIETHMKTEIDTFAETTKVVLDGLAALGKIHPIIEAAVVTFHAVISLNLSRRDNDWKVIRIMLEMRNMMCAMFQLRQLKHTDVQENERDAEKSCLRWLIENITADIKQCGSDLHYYLGQKIAIRFIQAKKFEQRFKVHVENFATRRSELDRTIALWLWNHDHQRKPVESAHEVPLPYVPSIVLGANASDIELQINTFSEITKVVLDRLVGLGKIYPIIEAAVLAFHAVISLNISRRNNDRKVIRTLLEMRNMMCDMFQLRHLKHTDVQESEKDAEKSRLRRLIGNITADIKQCGSDLHYYHGQKVAIKLYKAKNFEKQFKAHIENFVIRRSQLQSTITLWWQNHEGHQWGLTEPAHEDPPLSTPTWNHEGRQWRSAETGQEEPPPSASTSRQGDGFTGEASPIDFMDVDESHPRSQRRSELRMKSGARSGASSQSSASMFTNAKVTISGGTFVTAAHNYEAESSAFTRGPAFSMAMLGLQAVSFATRSNYPHLDNQLGLSPVLAPSTVDVALRFPSLFSEMRIMLAPLTLWFFLKMWIQRRASEHY